MEMFNFDSIDFVGWYLNLPLPAQIALVVGGIAVAILAIILAAYLIKWIFMALIYLIKGIIKSVKWGVKQVKDAAKAPYQSPASVQEKDPFTNKLPVAPLAPIRTKTPDDTLPRFCPRCGTPLEANVRTRLGSGQSAFCSQCGASLSERDSHAPASVQA